MTADQLFLAIGEIDNALVAAATRPPRRHRVLYGWMLAAAAAVVIGVVGYGTVLRAVQDKPPVQPPTPIVAVTTTTEDTTQDTPSSVPSPETGESTTDTSTVIPSGSSETSTTTAPPVSSTTPPSSTTSIMTPPTTGDPTSTTTTVYPTGPGYSGTTTVSSTTPDTTPTVPPTKGTAPDGRPLLNSDCLVETDRAYGYVDYVYGFSFEELEVQSITAAPVTLPVYTVGDDPHDDRSLFTILREYAALVGDPLAAIMDEGPTRASATGERFYYSINRDATNFVRMRLNDPLPLTAPDKWLDEAMAYCPALFRHMKQPTLYLYNGGRWWNKETTTSPAVAQKAVTFRARVYDAANDPDGVANWLNGVTLQVEDGKLVAFLVMSEERYHKVGNYPILSIEEATALAHRQCETLKDYPYYEIINENYTILSTEIVYMPHSGSHLRVPLYRFLVTADQTDYMNELRAETGLIPYYAVYVTAVPPSYWTDESRDRFITQD